MTIHQRHWRETLIAVGLLAVALVPSLSCGGGAEESEFPAIRDLTDFYDEYGLDHPGFVSHETDAFISFFRQRMVGEAVVQRDHVLYLFEKAGGTLRKERIRWDAPVPARLPPNLMSQAEAEALAGGGVASSRLLYVASDSISIALDPVPTNPCWICCSGECGGPGCVIVDAVQRVVLGTTVPAPDHPGPDPNAFSTTGPTEQDPCAKDWNPWRNNAANWFDAMGYTTETRRWPTEDEIRSRVQSATTAMFYEIGHSNYTPGILFRSGCDGGFYEETTAQEIHAWITHYTKMPFTFLASCYAMSGTGIDTLSFAFRKGSKHDTAVVGFREMTTDTCKQPCWVTGYAFEWQDTLFDYMSQGYAVKDAFDLATLEYPPCAPCTGFVGDESFAVVPVILRGWYFERIHIVLRRIPEILDLPGPGPVSRRHLEDALQDVEAAHDAVAAGDPRAALLWTHQAIQSLESARVLDVPEAGEVIDTLVRGVDRHVSDALTDATDVVDPTNEDLLRATMLHAQARVLLDEGNALGAVERFIEVWDFILAALGQAMGR